ncbi:MFS transporter [Halomonas caseinilytica]|uniref:Predicted arabinose efflux permease, MFS family n=1 Tax=Halomonas caseinilytica TaxID=438744 RepID=A0A1M6PAK9_9GAMM|nr:MFS transporter [Halomonas caseinilytica]SHK04900.1 Predicted arabinose efflux permease, MFS family [Halomonas caseinilytica]
MNDVSQRTPPAWSAVFSMTLGVFGLVTAEFLPVSLLTPMAADLAITEGMAGQAVTATAAVALVTSLLITAATRRIDRRYVLLAFSGLLVISNLLVAYAPNMPSLLLGRVLLGVALGGFWTMSAATVMRLVPEDSVPRALSMIFSGVSVATIVAAPMGSFFGEIIGWRNVFLIAALFGALAFLVQLATLPRMAPNARTRLKTLFEVLQRPMVGLGMLAAAMIFAGHFAFFTYIRPFLETVTRVDVNGMSSILLGFGLANFLGTFLGGFMLERNMRLTQIVMPATMGILGLGLAGVGGVPLLDAMMIALWGMAFGTVPVAWSTWLTRTVPDEAESAGGLLVAAIQFAIASGAAVGGLIFDAGGAIGVFMVSGSVLLLAALLILFGIKAQTAAAT